MRNKRQHALVIGGSIAGCLAAAILARYYERVTIIEKGDFDDDNSDRRHVPQEKHVHLLLLKGKHIMEQIFPGLLADLENAGAVVADLGHDVKWYQYGLWKHRYPSGIKAHYSSRRLIDNHLRRRMRTHHNIAILSHTTVTGLHFVREYGIVKVDGVSTTNQSGTQQLAASLVIDASGRSSRTAQWLTAAQLGEIPQTLIETRLGYASRIYRRQPRYHDRWQVLLVLPQPPQQRCMGVISPIEGERWLVTTGGWFDHFPRPTPEDFLAFLHTLPVPDIYDAIRDAEPLSEVTSYRMPGSRRRHYECIREWPDGLLVMGDALCSLNPLYSQGMTLCALEADCLAQHIGGWLDGRYNGAYIQQLLSQLIQPAWDMATTEDLRFPETKGPRTLRIRFRHWYGAGLAELSASHRMALRTQIAVTNLVMPAHQVYRPHIASRIVFNAIRKCMLTRSDQQP